jgi:hypothetical protein
MKQTAVEWLFDNLLEEAPNGELRYQLKEDIIGLFEKAKEMEKEQHKKTWVNGMFCDNGDEIDEFANYYNQYIKSDIR